MRHNVHLFLGKDYEDFARRLKDYTLGHGAEGTDAFLQTMWIGGGDEGELRVVRTHTELNDEGEPVAVPGLPEIIAPDNQEAKLKLSFRNLFTGTITIENPGDTPHLLLTVHLPAYDARAVGLFRKVIQAVDGVDNRFEVDVVCWCHDVGNVVEGSNEDENLSRSNDLIATEKQTLGWLSSLNGSLSKKLVHHIIPLQNTNCEGFSMGFTPESVLRVMGEFALQCVENYFVMFPNTYDPEHAVSALGLSVLHLDRQYFVQYLMRRTFISILENEGVTQEDVDINKIAPIAKRCLQNREIGRDYTKLFEHFWDSEVAPRIDRGLSQEDIIAEVSPIVSRLFEGELVDALTEYLPGDELSLPEKKCVLALVLGQDDNQLKNNMFSPNQYTIDDIIAQPLELFVKENNQLVSSSKGDAELQQEVRHVALDAPQDQSGRVFVPINELRSLKDRMRDSTHYMRQLGSQKDELKKQLDDSTDSTLRLTDKGFIFDGTTYKLNKDFSEHDLDEIYEGHGNLPDSVDMRGGFTAVRDQGSQGSCAAFAVVGIFEYLMKTTGEKVATNLSESFVYYNLRKKRGEHAEDKGGSISDAISSVGTQGVCLEELCPYVAGDFTTEPSAVAYNDGLTRTIATAKSIRLDEDIDRNVQNLRSAIADGYPVAIALRICESFNATKGFVSKPEQSEIDAKSKGNHAMVVCGYSDKEKFFIVRNSWGTRFGDRGYCYIPYSYVADPTLNLGSFIITEINVANSRRTISKQDDSVNKKVNFDVADATIGYAVASNLLEEEKRHFALLENVYNKLQTSFRTMVTKLQNNAVRRLIVDAGSNRLQGVMAAHRSEIAHLHEVLQNELREHDSQYRQYLIMAGGYILLTLLITYLFYFKLDWGRFWFYASMVGLGIVFLMFWIPYMKARRSKIKRSRMNQIKAHTDDITHNEKELTTLAMKYHISGIFIDQFASLQKLLMQKYHSMMSLCGNLRVWHDEENAGISQMDTFRREPFIPLLDNETLNAYFEKKRESLTGGIRLVEFLDNFEVGAGGILELQKQLRGRVGKLLAEEIADFSVFGFLDNPEQYPYLSKDVARTDKLLPLMTRKSQPFVEFTQIVDETPRYTCLLVHTANYGEQSRWESIYPQYFSVKPDSHKMLSPYKLLLVTVKPLKVEELKIMR